MNGKREFPSYTIATWMTNTKMNLVQFSLKVHGKQNSKQISFIDMKIYIFLREPLQISCQYTIIKVVHKTTEYGRNHIGSPIFLQGFRGIYPPDIKIPKANCASRHVSDVIPENGIAIR